MGFFSGGPSRKKLRRDAEAAEARERKRMQEAEQRARQDSIFARTEGQGVSEITNINLFDEETMTRETRAEGLFRGSGKVNAELVL